MNIIKGKFELRGKQWKVSVERATGNLIKATIENDGVAYYGLMEDMEPDAAEMALNYAFGNMLAAGDITYDEMEQLATEYAPDCNDIIHAIMIGLEG